MTKKTENAEIAASRKYSDGGKMRSSKNLTESRKTATSKKVSAKRASELVDGMRKMVAVPDDGNRSPIVFDREIRKIFVRGVLEDIKGYFESKTDGKVEITYEESDLGHYEFGFRLFVKQGSECSKQIFSEVSNAVENVVNYMFPPTDAKTHEISSFKEDECLEIEIYSAW